MTDVEGELVFDGPARRCVAASDESSRIIAAEVWDHDDYRFAEHAPGATVLDVGANVGLAALAALAHGAERVVCVEPDAVNLGLLEQNLARSDVRELCEVHAVAVGASEGTRVVRRDPNVPGDALSGRSWTDTYLEPGADTVRALPLDAVAPPGELVLKMDTEGAEYDAFAGATDELLGRCTWIALEYHHEPRRPAIDSTRRLPGLIARLLPTHDVEVRGTFADGVGMLYAGRRW